MQGLEVMDTYTSASCDQQLHWINPSGPALSRTKSLGSEERSISPAAGSSGQVCRKTDICLWYLLAKAWLLSCRAALGEQPPKIRSKKNSNATHHLSYQSSQYKFLGKADTKTFAKFHWSSVLFFFFFNPMCSFFAFFPYCQLRTLFMKWNYWSRV